MKRKRFTYENPRFLNDLVQMFGGDRCKLSVTLAPDIEEFLRARRNTEGFRLVDYFPEYGSSLVDLKKQPSQRTVDFLIRLGLCKKHCIKPYCSLVFSEGRDIELKHTLYDIEDTVYREVFNLLRDPLHFAMQGLYWDIEFTDFKGESEVESAKRAIAEFVKPVHGFNKDQAYRVIDIYAKLNARIRTSDHYYDSEECDATLHAYDGEVELSGDFPDDFDISEQGIARYRQEQSRSTGSQLMLFGQKVVEYDYTKELERKLLGDK